MTIIFIKKIIPLRPNKLLMCLNLGYLGIEKEFPEQLHLYRIEKRRSGNCHNRRIQNITKSF